MIGLQNHAISRVTSVTHSFETGPCIRYHNLIKRIFPEFGFLSYT
jgi:hypothetical protein